MRPARATPGPTESESRLRAALVVLARSHAGLNKVAFSGRVRGKALAPGRYQVAFIAIDSAGASPPKTLTLTIVKRSA